MPNIFSRFFGAPDRVDWLRQYLRYKSAAAHRRFAPPASASRDGRYYLARRGEHTLLLDRTCTIDDSMLEHATWEREQCAIMLSAFRAFAGEDPVFLDVGAFWGLYALMAVKAGVRHVHALEPDPRNHAQLQAQLFLNDLTAAIRVHHLAASDHDGEVFLRRSETLDDGNRGGAGIVAAACEEAVSVPCARLDRLFGFRGRTILVKIDAEEHELQVLRGMRELVQNNRIFLQVESFEAQRAETIELARSMGLDYLATVAVDHFMTNIPGVDAAWLSGAVARP